MENILNIASIQMISGLKFNENLDRAEILVKEAASLGAKVAVLPEFFVVISEARDNSFQEITEELGNGKIQQRLQKIARENNIHLIAGSMPIKSKNSHKCFNCTLVYDNKGNLVCDYNKIHLFKFENSTFKFDEGITFESGKKITTIEIEGFTFGLAICYDLRFPEMFRMMKNVDGIILPAAFLHHTGQDHWEILLRARAIENQCYVIASGQGGMHENGRHTFGHSMIIDPWGRVLSVLETGEGIVMANISRHTINEIRGQLPALDNRVF